MKNQNPANYFNKLFSILIVVLFISVSVNGADLAITFNVSKYQNGNNISCFGAHDGMVEAVIVGGTSPYTYSWNTGSFNRVLTGIGSGTYTFTVTDASAQTVSSSVGMIEPAILELTLLPELYGGYNISEQGGNDGKIISEIKGGSQPYSYSWSTTSTEPNIIGLTAGAYNLSVTDANGCTISGSKTLTEPTPLHIVSITSPQHHGYNVSCNEGHDGQIDLNVTGGVPPYKYDWNTGSFEEDIINLSAGEYSVRVTDDNGAEILTSILLTEPIGVFKITMTPQLYANGFNLSCHDCANGSITAIGVNGVSPFSYLWSNSQTTATISGLQAIDYSCMLTDANGCSAKAQLALHAPDRDDWSMNGNANVDSATQFMGTTDNKSFVIKTDNVERIKISGSGGVTIHSLVGTDNRILLTNASGEIFSGNIVVPDQVTGLCQSLPFVPAWQRKSTIGPWGGADLINCNQRFGFGVLAPTERISVAGFASFSYGFTDYLKIGNDGNSRISSFGAGELLINENSTQNVKIATGVNSGDVSIGGNTLLATLRGRVFIGNASNISELQIGTKFTFRGDPTNSIIGSNYSYFSGSDLRLVQGAVSRIVFGSQGEISAQVAPDGAAGSTIGSTDWINAIQINSDGKVGIGTTSPTSTLHVKGNFKITESSNQGALEFGFLSAYSTIIHTSDLLTLSATHLDISSPVRITNLTNGLVTSDAQGNLSNLGFNSTPNQVLLSSGVWGSTPSLQWTPDAINENVYSTNSGCIAIGTTDFTNCSNYKLAVNGGIIAESIKVKLNGNWPDYVFSKNYKLMPLKELSNFVKKYNHLPEITSAQAMKKNGIDLAEMNQVLLKKVEELTLYMILLNEKIEALNKSKIK